MSDTKALKLILIEPLPGNYTDIANRLLVYRDQAAAELAELKQRPTVDAYKWACDALTRNHNALEHWKIAYQDALKRIAILEQENKDFHEDWGKQKRAYLNYIETLANKLTKETK